MRTKNSIKNVVVAALLNLITIIIGLVSQKIFISSLGTDYLGVNGLFTNIISMLGIVELGLGSAIIYNLYKPIATNNKKQIKSLMHFYKTSYRIIAAVITVIGILIIPFLGIIAKDANISESLIIVYLLFLVDIVCSYLLTYKRSILYANQKSYIINIVHIGYLVLMNFFQIFILIYTKNYYLYLIIKIVARLIENIIITYIANRLYPILQEKDVEPLDKTTKEDIFIKIKALLFHKIGGFIVLGSDNIIISTFLGVTTVGLYSNYNMIINVLVNLSNQVFSAITASVGNLLVTSNKKKTFSVYKNISFANTWLAGFAAIGLLTCMDSFVSIWLGEKYVLSIGVLLTLCINLYLQITRYTNNSFKEAAGIFYEDRYVPIIESLVNIIMSIILLHFFGLAGVFMGTICSNLVLHLYSYPKFVYTKLFKKNYRSYYISFTKNLLLMTVIGAITFGTSRIINFDNQILNLLWDVIICIIVPNLLLYLYYRKTPELSYYMNLLKSMLSKVLKKDVHINRFVKINILSITSIICLIIFLYLLFSINILSVKVLTLVVLSLLIINILGIILINLKKKIINIIGIVIMIISILLSGIGSYYLYHTNAFLNETFSKEKKETTTYYIVTSKENKYNKKSDIKGKVYYYKNSANIKGILKKIKEDLNVKISAYDDVTSMINDIINQKIDFMLIDKTSYHAILNLKEKIEKEKMKVVYKFDIEKTTKNQSKEKEAFNIYIRGIDSDGLSDYNAIATVNTRTHEILLTSIPRDYYMEIYGTNGKKDSLSHMFIYPDGTSKKSLEQFFDITLDYSVNITPEGVVDLVDKIGGITYCSDQSFDAYIVALNSTDKRRHGPLYIKEGCQQLDGMETYAVAHERNSFVGRDRMRQKNCQKIIIAVFEKLKSTNSFINYKEILDSVSNLYSTDIPREVITKVVQDTIDGAEWNIMTQSVDGTDKWDADIAILKDKGYAMIPNESDVINATKKINELLKKK